MNPREIDYGAALQRKRRIFLLQFRDRRHWEEATALGLMFLGWGLVVRQRGEKLRREIVTAELLAQYHNALAEARFRLEKAVADNATLREAAQSRTSCDTAVPSSAMQAVDSAAIYLESNFPSRRSSRSAAGPLGAQPATAHVTDLEQQLRESREREKLLERTLEKMPPQRRSPPQTSTSQGRYKT